MYGRGPSFDPRTEEGAANVEELYTGIPGAETAKRCKRDSEGCPSSDQEEEMVLVTEHMDWMTFPPAPKCVDGSPNEALEVALRELCSFYKAFGDSKPMGEGNESNDIRALQTRRVLFAVRSAGGVIRRGSQLKGLKGVGDSWIRRLDILLRGEKLPIMLSHWDEYLVVREFTKVFGIGAVTAGKLYDEGYRTLDHLQSVAEWRLSPEQQIGLKYVADLEKEIPRFEVEQWRRLVSDCVPPGDEVVLLGSYARGIPPDACSDVDICIRSPLYSDDGMGADGHRTLLIERILEQLKPYLFHQFNSETPQFGSQSKDEWWQSRVDSRSFKHRLVMCLGRLTPQHPVRRIDLFQCSARSWAAMQLYVTGNVWFNRKIREHAERKGFMLNNSAFGKISAAGGLVEPLDFKEERDIMEALGIPYIPPTRRDY